MKKIMVYMALIGIALLWLQLFVLRSVCDPFETDAVWERKLPKALFLTTGLNYGNGTLAAGVSLALQSFNRLGVPVRLENREILYDSTALAGYDIIIALTASGYHDADRKHSLIYMTNDEMTRLNRWVHEGGVLIAGDNVGRYYPDGTDRARFTGGRLSGENWPLGKCFGITLQERNMRGFTLSGNWEADTLAGWEVDIGDRWRTVPVERYPAVRVAAWWHCDSLAFPAVTQYQYGDGKGVLLTSSNLLHPVNDGGWLGVADIEGFYVAIAKGLMQPADSSLSLQLHPWPNAAPYAMCVTLDAEGIMPAFENTVNLMQDHGLQPAFYVNAHLDSAVRTALKMRGFPLYSHGFDPVSGYGLDCYGSRHNILRNEQYWVKRFTGNRFHGGSAAFPGLQTLAARGYLFDNSLGADNISHLAGGTVPYNIPLNNTGFRVPSSQESFYTVSDLLEISSVAKDDYHFFADLGSKNGYDDGRMRLDALRYGKYLQLFVKDAVRPVAGVASYFGHVSNTGHNEITMEPLRNFIRTGLRDTAWITGIDSIALYTNALRDLRFSVQERQHELIVSVTGSAGINVPGCTVSTAAKPKVAEVKYGDCAIRRRGIVWCISFNARDGQELMLRF